jgi:DNA segregation ATPase FtsK/SpoIIIE, S-DNA-T family
MLIEEGIIMTLVSSGVSISPVDEHPALMDRRRSRWTPRWLQRWLERRREVDELGRWANEVMWQWNDTMDGIGLAHRTTSAGRIPVLVVPQVQLVEPGPPVSLLVRVLPGQIVDDFQAQAHRIAASMDVPMVHITPYGHGLIKVALLDHEPLSSVMPLPAYTTVT